MTDNKSLTSVQTLRQRARQNIGEGNSYSNDQGGFDRRAHRNRQLPEMIDYLGDRDPTTRRMLESILAVEKKHADDLVGLLESGRIQSAMCCLANK